MKHISESDKLNSGSEEIEKLLEAGEQRIKLSDARELILILGNTGAGKSSLTGWLLRDNSKLISKETFDNNGEYIITDNNDRIGRSTIKSKTIYPEHFIEHETGAVYYDCPGFSDTRSTSHDISTTYFNKKLTDHAEKVKLVLVLSYSSVRKGVDRADFMKLMKHCTELIRNVNHFKDSICIVVTKVDNIVIMHNHEYKLISDDIVKESIVDFLQEVKQDTYDQQIANLIDILCIKNKENYQRIGLFRRPNASGPLSDIELLRKSKTMVQEMIRNNIEFTFKTDDDFGYTISNKSKNEINGLVKKIDEKVACHVQEVVNEIKEIFEKKILYIFSLLDNCGNRINEVFLESIRNLIEDLDQGDKKIKEYMEKIKKFENLNELTQQVEELSKLDFEISAELLIKINNQANFLKFLQTVSDKKLEINKSNWIVHLQDLANYILEYNDKIKIRIIELEKKNAILRAEEEARRREEENRRAHEEEMRLKEEEARRREEENRRAHEEEMRLKEEEARRREEENRRAHEEEMRLKEEEARRREEENRRVHEEMRLREEEARRREEENRRVHEENQRQLREQMEATNRAQEEARRAWQSHRQLQIRGGGGRKQCILQ